MNAFIAKPIEQHLLLKSLLPYLPHRPVSPGDTAVAIAQPSAVFNTDNLQRLCAASPDVHLTMAHPWAVAWFGLMGAVMLSFFGLLTSLWAEKFDHAAAITNFVVAPLSLLSGTFYTIHNLTPGFQMVSLANPFFYVISGFRYGFLGISDVPLGTAYLIIIGFIVALYGLAWWLISRGTGLRH